MCGGIADRWMDRGWLADWLEDGCCDLIWWRLNMEYGYGYSSSRCGVGWIVEGREGNSGDGVCGRSIGVATWSNLWGEEGGALRRGYR